MHTIYPVNDRYAYGYDLWRRLGARPNYRVVGFGEHGDAERSHDDRVVLSSGGELWWTSKGVRLRRRAEIMW